MFLYVLCARCVCVCICFDMFVYGLCMAFVMCLYLLCMVCLICVCIDSGMRVYVCCTCCVRVVSVFYGS